MRRGTGARRRWLGIASRNRRKSVAVGQGNDLGRGRESDGGFRPAQQPCRLEPSEGFLEPLGGQPGEPLQLVEPEAAGRGAGLRQRRDRISQAANQTRRSTSRMSFSW